MSRLGSYKESDPDKRGWGRKHVGRVILWKLADAAKDGEVGSKDMGVLFEADVWKIDEVQLRALLVEGEL